MVHICDGFLSIESTNTNIKFDLLHSHLQIYESLPGLVASGRLRNAIKDLPLVNIVFEYESVYDESCLLLETEREQNTVFTLFAILSSSYVQTESLEFLGEGTVGISNQGPLILPDCIAIPMKIMAQHLGRLPILDYTACVLTNWELINPHEDMSLENVRAPWTFTRLPSEEWFYKIHIVIEHHGGDAIRCIQEIYNIARPKELGNAPGDASFDAIHRIHNLLENIAVDIENMNQTLDRMREGCKSHEFFNVVRPWLSGFKAPGVIYGSTSDKPETYSGGSGAQSAIMPCFDAFFGLRHNRDADNEFCQFSKMLRNYRKSMDPNHRGLIAWLEGEPSIRDYIAFVEHTQRMYNEKSSDKSNPLYLTEESERNSIRLGEMIKRLKTVYNLCVERILSFRRKHIGFAISYITSQARRRSSEMTDRETADALLDQAKQGTGGSHFSQHLTRHIEDTRRCLYELAEPRANPAISDNLDEHNRGGSMRSVSIFSKYDQ